MSAKKIVIGTANGKQVGFDANLLLATRLLITADSGGGKSYLARVLFEQSFGKLQTIIIDPEGEFASLREKFPFVLAGKGGDTPIDIRSAGMLAHRLLKLRVSAICDLYEVRADERHLWLKAFLESLIEAPKELRTPLLLGIDEFHMFAPEHGQGESEALNASIDVATRGRKRGICLIGMTQRLAMLNKNVTSQLQNRLVGAQFEEVNVKVASKLFGIAPGAEEREFRKELQLLEPGQFFAFGRAISRERILVKVREVVTSHPKAFEKHVAPPPPVPGEIKALLPQLADLPKEAEEKFRTEAEYKREIRELKAQLKRAPKPAAEVDTGQHRQLAVKVKQLKSALEAAMKIVAKITASGFDKTSVTKEEVQKALEAASSQIVKFAEAKLSARANEFSRLQREATAMLERMNALVKEENIELAVAVKHNEPFTVASPPLPRSGSIRPATKTFTGNGDLSAAQVKILSRLTELMDSTGSTSVRKEQLAAWTEYSPNSGGFNNYLGALRSAGLIEYPSGGRVTITEEGRKHAQPEDAPTDSTEMLARAKRVLGGSEGKLLELLYSSRNAMSKIELAEAAGFSPNSGGFNNYLGHMRTLGFVDYPAPGQVKAADWLYLDAA